MAIELITFFMVFFLLGLTMGWLERGHHERRKLRQMGRAAARRGPDMVNTRSESERLDKMTLAEQQAEFDQTLAAAKAAAGQRT